MKSFSELNVQKHLFSIPFKHSFNHTLVDCISLLPFGSTTPTFKKIILPVDQNKVYRIMCKQYFEDKIIGNNLHFEDSNAIS